MQGVKRERIIRVLLNDPDGKLSKYRVAKLSGCSIGWTMDYLKQLSEQGLIDNTKVIDKEALIRFWSTIKKKPRTVSFFVQSPLEFLRTKKEKYGLTTYFAENQLNHHLFPTRADVYILEHDLKKWSDHIKTDGLMGKGNMRLLVYDDHTLYERKKYNGVFVVSVPQVMVDLLTEGGVAVEAYEMMVKRYVC